VRIILPVSLTVNRTGDAIAECIRGINIDRLRGSGASQIKQATDLLVREAMQRANGNQSIAAGMLGISQQALSKRLKKEREK